MNYKNFDRESVTSIFIMSFFYLYSLLSAAFSLSLHLDFFTGVICIHTIRTHTYTFLSYLSLLTGVFIARCAMCYIYFYNSFDIKNKSKIKRRKKKRILALQSNMRTVCRHSMRFFNSRSLCPFLFLFSQQQILMCMSCTSGASFLCCCSCFSFYHSTTISISRFLQLEMAKITTTASQRWHENQTEIIIMCARAHFAHILNKMSATKCVAVNCIQNKMFAPARMPMRAYFIAIDQMCAMCKMSSKVHNKQLCT